MVVVIITTLLAAKERISEAAALARVLFFNLALSASHEIEEDGKQSDTGHEVTVR